MAEERKGFSFLLSYYTIYKKLKDPVAKDQFITAICEKQFYGKEPNFEEMEFTAELAYTGQKHSVDKSRKGFEDVQKRKNIVVPSVDPSEGGSKGASVDPSEQEKEKEEEQVKEKEKEKVKPNINDRKQSFLLQLKEFEGDYSKDILNDFYAYWTEHGVNDKKMRFEKEKSFGMSRRLSTWKRNNKKFNNGSTGTTSFSQRNAATTTKLQRQDYD